MAFHMPLISVIVPIYNVAPYLSQCIESLQQQIYSPLEIVLVDDGSTDNSGDIADQYANKDNRIIVFHKTNGGLSDARNYGIKHANGAYYIFVDSDDYVSSEYVYHLYHLLSSTHTLIAVTDLKPFKDGEKKTRRIVPIRQRETSPIVLSAHDALENMLYMRDIEPNAFAKIYDKILFDEIQFPVGKLYEDIATTAKLFDKAGTVAYAQDADYYYRIRKNSIQTSGFSLKTLDLLDQLNIIKKIVQTKYPDIFPAYRSKLQSALFNLYMKIPYNDKIYKKIACELWSQIIDNRREVIQDKNARPDARIASILSFLGQGICRAVYRMVRQ